MRDVVDPEYMQELSEYVQRKEVCNSKASFGQSRGSKNACPIHQGRMRHEGLVTGYCSFNSHGCPSGRLIDKFQRYANPRKRFVDINYERGLLIVMLPNVVMMNCICHYL